VGATPLLFTGSHEAPVPRGGARFPAEQPASRPCSVDESVAQKYRCRCPALVSPMGLVPLQGVHSPRSGSLPRQADRRNAPWNRHAKRRASTPGRCYRATADARSLLVKRAGIDDALTVSSDVAASPRQEGNDTRHGQGRGRNRTLRCSHQQLPRRTATLPGWVLGLRASMRSRSSGCPQGAIRPRVTVSGPTTSTGCPAVVMVDLVTSTAVPSRRSPGCPERSSRGSRRSVDVRQSSAAMVAHRGFAPASDGLRSPLRSAPPGCPGRGSARLRTIEHRSQARCPPVARRVPAPARGGDRREPFLMLSGRPSSNRWISRGTLSNTSVELGRRPGECRLVFLCTPGFRTRFGRSEEPPEPRCPQGAPLTLHACACVEGLVPPGGGSARCVIRLAARPPLSAAGASFQVGGEAASEETAGIPSGVRPTGGSRSPSRNPGPRRSTPG